MKYHQVSRILKIQVASQPWSRNSSANVSKNDYPVTKVSLYFSLACVLINIHTDSPKHKANPLREITVVNKDSNIKNDDEYNFGTCCVLHPLS